jgi:hypothetical protein
MTSPVRLVLTPDVSGSIVEVEGVQIQGAVHGLDLVVARGGSPLLRIDLEPDRNIEVNGTMTVRIDAGTRLMLERLGWLNPSDAAELRALAAQRLAARPVVQA